MDFMGPLAQGVQLWFGDLLDSSRVDIWGMQKREERRERRKGLWWRTEDLLKETHSKRSGS